MLIKSITGAELGGASSSRTGQDGLAFVEAGMQVKVIFQFQCRLNPGTYFLNAGVLGVMDGAEVYLHRLLDAAMFRVMPVRDSAQTGTVSFDCSAQIRVMETA